MSNRTYSLVPPSRIYGYVVGLFVALAVVLFFLGRRFWGVSGEVGFWSGDISSSHNSQFLLDPYSLTHVIHGILFYALMARFKKISWPTKVLLALGLESLWEIIENTDTVIEHYRAATISLNYYGDSIVNSLSDLAMSLVGFFLTRRLPLWASVAGLVTIELLLLYWIRDSLFLNIIMLVYPMTALKEWQLGR